jgi:nitrogen-specific signal transduction histidine kinase
MTLSEFIIANQDDIAEEWIEFAGKYILSAFEMNREELKDHVVDMLEAIAHDMKTDQTNQEQLNKSRGLRQVTSEDDVSALGHATQRLKSGFNLVQICSEFRALRASVLRLWEEKMQYGAHDISYHELVRFNEAIDEAWMKSVKYCHDKTEQSRHWLLAILGHDLRGPLSTLATAQGILEASPNLSKDEKQIIKTAKSGIKRMEVLISNLLELTELNLGTGIEIEKKQVSLDEKCSEIISEFQLAHPNINFRYKSPGNVKGEWDGVRLGQLIGNLLANAVEHGPANSPVTLTLSADAEKVRLSVHNEGNPIPVESQQKIFEGLYKLTDDSDKNTGHGIGLYVVNEITKAHGGNIILVSNEKEGTTFTIELPKTIPEELISRKPLLQR